MSDYAETIWKLLWHYIANESPDYDYEDIGEELCERILPQVWDNVQKLNTYADKLADGFPEGMLPKDIELIKQANAEMAARILELEGDAGNE